MLIIVKSKVVIARALMKTYNILTVLISVDGLCIFRKGSIKTLEHVLVLEAFVYVLLQ